MAPPPQTRATEHIGHRASNSSNRAHQASVTARSKIGLIGLDIASLATLGLESSPRCATAAPPLRPQGVDTQFCMHNLIKEDG